MDCPWRPLPGTRPGVRAAEQDKPSFLHLLPELRLPMLPVFWRADRGVGDWTRCGGWGHGTEGGVSGKGAIGDGMKSWRTGHRYRMR